MSKPASPLEMVILTLGVVAFVSGLLFAGYYSSVKTSLGEKENEPEILNGSEVVKLNSMEERTVC